MGSIAYDNATSPQVSYQEIISESTYPVLSYFLNCLRDNDSSEADIFSKVKSLVGEAPRPVNTDELPSIPDESILVEADYINLINLGPSGKNKKIDGSPTVSLSHHKSPMPS